jgi:ketosteroid isomerase-like protein
MRNSVWMTFAIAVVFFSALLFSQPPGTKRRDCSESLSSADAAAIKSVIEAYQASWLKGDVAGVQHTLTAESVLLPSHGAEPVVGLERIKEFWWPKHAPPTKILRLDISVDGIGGNTCLAYARGADTVAWSTIQDGKPTRTQHKGTYLNVMKKMSDGSWRILQHMWDDQPNESF